MSTLDELVRALDEDRSETTTTFVREPVALRDALHLAVELGMASTADDARGQALRDAVERFAMTQALDEQYDAHPEAMPPFHEVAHALAIVDRSPLTDRPDLLQRAAEEVVGYRPDADGDDVLLWALALLERERHAEPSPQG